MALVNLNNRLNRRNYYNRSPWAKRFLIRIGIIFLILVILAGLPGKIIFDGVKDLQLHSKAVAAAYQNQNFGQLQQEVTATKQSLQKMNTSLNFLIWMSPIPFVGGYYSDIRSLTGAGVEELSAIETILNKLRPQEKELGFIGAPLSGPDRVSQGVKLLQAALPYLDSVQPQFKKARRSVENIDTNKYPNEFRGMPFGQLVRMSKDFIVGADEVVSNHRDILQQLPTMLGINSPKNYLMLFQNDKEIRPTGGFITAFAFLRIDKGQISTTISDDIYRLDERLLATCQSKICPLAPPEPIVKYLPEVSGKARSAWSMRDSNISPHLPTSAKEFERMYQLLGQGLPFDGVIFIDSQVVEELIEVTGPIDIFGTPYSAKVDHRCNCPNVIYELENYSEIAARGEQDRKAILGVLMQQILAKSLGSSSERIPQLLETIVRLANHKHVMFYMHDSSVQTSFSNLNWTGQIRPYSGDYLHINDANFAGGKSNLYVEQTVTQEISKQSDGTYGYKKKLSIEYKNPQPFNIWLNGINRDYVRVYVPKGSKLLFSKGSEDGVRTLEDLDKTVFEAFITVRPQNSRKLEFEYIIPYKPGDKYELLIQKQPGAKDFRYIIKLNSSQEANFKLDQDKEFKFDI
ncbi:MAG: DUF4012 domain-containing protein [Candidatus Daviesbacteria bacterium]|nr:MAG: DUF4012 domain-containing protein [Candidatus Daviesbacteria bacterium]